MDRAVGLTKSGIEESSNERPLPSSLSGGGARSYVFKPRAAPAQNWHILPANIMTDQC